MNTAQIIYQQLGGNKFTVMTGSKNYVSDGDALRMTLAKNASRANRLNITLDRATDTYTMRFYRFTPGRLVINHKAGTAKFTDDKTEEVKTYTGIYCDQLCELFETVTGLYTKLY